MRALENRRPRPETDNLRTGIRTRVQTLPANALFPQRRAEIPEVEARSPLRANEAAARVHGWTLRRIL